MLKSLQIVCALLVLTLGFRVQAEPLLPACPPDRDEQLWSFMDTLLLAMYDQNPGSYYQIVNDESRLGELGDVSEASIQVWIDRQRELLEELRSLDQSGYSDADRTDHDLVQYQLMTSISRSKYKSHQIPITSISGPQIWLPQMGSRVPMRTQQHREMYVQRLRQVDVLIGDHMDNMRSGMQSNRVPPRVILGSTVDQVLAQCSAEIRKDPTKSPFFEPLRSLDANDPIAMEARTIIEERIIPVFMELALFLQNEYIPSCRASVGASDGIDGIEGYNAQLALHTTIPGITADQIHAVGLREVNRLKSEMMEVIGQTDWIEDPNGGGFLDTTAEGVFSAFTDYLRTDPRFYHTDPEELLTEYQAISKRVDPGMAELFYTLPRLSYGVKRLPEYQEPSAPTAYYYPGDLKSGVPGYFMANCSKLDQRPRYEMLALTMHEAVPGHHHQYALVSEIENQHPIRQTMSFTAYGEGWALYAESLGLEMGDRATNGLYADPYDNFGRLNMEMWRALRLVVDTGIHAKGWTRDQAIEYMTQNSALAPHNIASEVDRYIGWPGQATGYMLGQLSIRALRSRAEETLGDDFDLRAFHDELLKDGSIPLPILEKQINRWVVSQRSSVSP
ncbi:MAG: DUF885 domain-containing protein [Phycisphaerales bacterium]|nr:DUF885 domain-containing protein [Phycisphaerales bacterium]